MSDIFIAKKMKERNVIEVRLWKEWFENGGTSKKMFRCWAGIKWK